MHTLSNRLTGAAYLRSALAVGVFGSASIWLITKLTADGLYPLASAVGAVTVFVALVYLRRKFSPIRWMAIGLALAFLFTLYPMFYNIYIGFTNMRDGHLLSKSQIIERFENEFYLPEDAATYRWVAYRSGNSHALWLVGEDGASLFATPGETEEVEALDGAIPDPDSIDSFPSTHGEYTRMSPRETVQLLTTLGGIDFGAPPDTFRIRSIREAAQLERLYVYDPVRDTLVNQQTGDSFVAEEGTFVSADGNELIPGYMVALGTDNFARFLGNPTLRELLGRVVLWDFAFAFFSVVLSFIVGLIVTLLFEDLPGKRLIRALLIVPYPIPVLVSVLIWRAMLNPDQGAIGKLLGDIFGSSPQFYLDPTWTRIALILVNIWLSFPYFYVISSGAMRSIDPDVFAATAVDGASPWQQFRFITLPLLLRIMMPLLIASFSFNFNNFNLIYIFNFGGPPVAETLIPIGHTDILISFIFKLAFVSSSIADYGLAAAISVILFVLVGTMAWLQARYTKAFETA